MRGFGRLSACASTAVLASLLASGAFAQDGQDSQVEVVTVTGTSIRGVATVASPVASVDLEDVKQAGASQASEAVRMLPQILNLGADDSRNSFTAASGGGGAQDAAANATAVRSVNLRGLGPEATLILVDGRRIPPSGVIKAIYDLDVIPTAALARIEVVPDGASAIYGSDAVAGVVNLITRGGRDEATSLVRYGGADGMDQLILSQTYGKTWQGGSIFLAYEKNFRSNLSGADRDFASQDRRARGGTDSRPFTAAPGNILISTTGAACTSASLTAPNGTATCIRYALPPGNGVSVNPGSIQPASAVGPNRYDEGKAADLLPRQDREGYFVKARQDLTDKIDVWFEGVYTHRYFDLAAPPALFTLTVTNANPYYVRPAGAPAGTQETVEYRFSDDSNPNSDGRETTWIASTGAGWDITSEWRAEAYAAFGVDDGLQQRQSVLNNTVLGNALKSTNPATAFNPFGDGTFNRTNNAALVELIDGERNQYATSRTNDYGAKVDGPVFDLPGGPAKLAAGVEYQDLSFRQALYATNVDPNGAVTTKLVHNTREVTSAYAELFAPLVGDGNAMSGIQRLDLDLAFRYDDYSDFGSTTNPKIGLVYAPISDLSFRATWGTSYRAPSLVDSADQIKNIFIQNLTDPKAVAPATTTRGIFYNGGNSGLQPEDATSWTAGVDWNPKFLSGFHTTLTYYNVDYTNRIDVVPNTALTNIAYDPYFIRRGDIPDAEFNALVAGFMGSPDLQNPVEAVTNINAIIDGRRQNLGSLKMDGVDLTAMYDFDSQWGDWTVGVDLSKVLTLERVTAKGLAAVDVLDTFGNPVDFRARGSLTWRQGPWSAASFVNYYDSYSNTAITPNVPVASYTTVDASVSYDFGDDGPLKGVRAILSAQNIFDEEPPVVLNGTVSWDSQGASPIGRFISLELSKRW